MQEYGTEEDRKTLGKITLNEKAVSDFAAICAIDEVQRKIERLTSKEDTYKLFGNYWLELANCYFENEEYDKCLECVQKYRDLEIEIFRKDFNIVPVLPKAIVSAQKVYDEKEYISKALDFANLIKDNANDEDWSVRYFAAQTYLDLYSKTNNEEYLQEAYKIVKDNVNLLIAEQDKLNKTYLADVKKETLDENEAKKMSDKDRKAEEKRLDAYNDSLEDIRKTELPPLYEPLVLNCDLLFALADKLEISNKEKTEISKFLQTEKNGIFLSDVINNKYRFDIAEEEYDVALSKGNIIIPAKLLVQGATVTVTVVDGKDTTVFDDFEIKKVKRAGDKVETFEAQYDSKKMRSYKWSSNSKIKIEISCGESFDPLVLQYKVKNHKGNWIFPDTVTFEKA